MADYCGAFVSLVSLLLEREERTLAQCALITYWNSFIQIEGGEAGRWSDGGSDGEVKESRGGTDGEVDDGALGARESEMGTREPPWLPDTQVLCIKSAIGE